MRMPRRDSISCSSRLSSRLSNDEVRAECHAFQGVGMRKCKLFLMFLLTYSSISLGQAPWTAFSGAGGRFKALLPDKPVQSSNAPPTFVVGTGSGVYAISYTDNHDGADWAETLKAEKESAISGLSGKVLQEKDISLAGFRGRSYSFDGNMPSGAIKGPIWGELRLYFNGHRFYMLMAVRPKRLNNADITRFMNSFQLVSAAQGH